VKKRSKALAIVALSEQRAAAGTAPPAVQQKYVALSLHSAGF
jgi:hypothetical protein